MGYWRGQSCPTEPQDHHLRMSPFQCSHSGGETRCSASCLLVGFAFWAAGDLTEQVALLTVLREGHALDAFWQEHPSPPTSHSALNRVWGLPLQHSVPKQHKRPEWGCPGGPVVKSLPSSAEKWV